MSDKMNAFDLDSILEEQHPEGEDSVQAEPNNENSPKPVKHLNPDLKNMESVLLKESAPSSGADAEPKESDHHVSHLNIRFARLLRIVLLAFSIVIALGFAFFFLIYRPYILSVTASTAESMLQSYDIQQHANTILDTLENAFFRNSVYEELKEAEVGYIITGDSPAPSPCEDRFGRTDDAYVIEALVNSYSELMGEQATYFSSKIEIAEDTQIQYYADNSILVLVWQQIIKDCTYTISEIKIANSSQFQRVFAGGRVNSGVKQSIVDMAAESNAVVALNGDGSALRDIGICISDGMITRYEHGELVTCCVSSDGKLDFIRTNEAKVPSVLEEYIKTNNTEFSLSCGPVLVDNGSVEKIQKYPINDVSKHQARSAIGQLGDGHYLLVTVTDSVQTGGVAIKVLASQMAAMGCKMAYALESGKDIGLVFHNELIGCTKKTNEIGDMICFVTAIPEEENIVKVEDNDTTH